MDWREQHTPHTFPRLRARIYELRRSASVAEMNAAVSQEKGGYDANHFRYENVMEEIEEIEALLAWYEAWVQRRSWSAWQSWVVLAAAVVSGILSVLALWVN